MEWCGNPFQIWNNTLKVPAKIEIFLYLLWNNVKNVCVRGSPKDSLLKHATEGKTEAKHKSQWFFLIEFLTAVIYTYIYTHFYFTCVTV